MKLRLYEEMKRKKEEREKRRLEKMRTLGVEFVMHERKRKLKKKLRKRKAAMKGSDDENDLDYKHEPKEPRVKKEKKDKKKKSRDGEKMYHEFSKYSSGSDGTGMEDESDIEELYQEIAVSGYLVRTKLIKDSSGLFGV